MHLTTVAVFSIMTDKQFKKKEGLWRAKIHQFDGITYFSIPARVLVLRRHKLPLLSQPARFDPWSSTIFMWEWECVPVTLKKELEKVSTNSLFIFFGRPIPLSPLLSSQIKLTRLLFPLSELHS